MQNQCKKPQLSRRNKHKVDRYDTRHVIKGKTGVKGWNLSPLGWSKILLRFKDNTWNVILVISTRSGSRIFLGGGALVSCCTSTPINHIVFFCRIPVELENRRSSQGGGGGGGGPAHPLHPPPRSAPEHTGNCSGLCSGE